MRGKKGKGGGVPPQLRVVSGTGKSNQKGDEPPTMQQAGQMQLHEHTMRFDTQTTVWLLWLTQELPFPNRATAMSALIKEKIEEIKMSKQGWQPCYRRGNEVVPAARKLPPKE
ncbi:MAG TPA: hypothetical protein VMX18_04155 [Candidatus Bipolaricaulota bacterium]|nr:hypothetical protein [Candidatus Bipolaricaulota bacterium]